VNALSYQMLSDHRGVLQSMSLLANPRLDTPDGGFAMITKPSPSSAVRTKKGALSRSHFDR